MEAKKREVEGTTVTTHAKRTLNNIYKYVYPEKLEDLNSLNKDFHETLNSSFTQNEAVKITVASFESKFIIIIASIYVLLDNLQFKHFKTKEDVKNIIIFFENGFSKKQVNVTHVIFNHISDEEVPLISYSTYRHKIQCIPDKCETFKDLPNISA